MKKPKPLWFRDGVSYIAPLHRLHHADLRRLGELFSQRGDSCELSRKSVVMTQPECHAVWWSDNVRMVAEGWRFPVVGDPVRNVRHHSHANYLRYLSVRACPPTVGRFAGSHAVIKSSTYRDQIELRRDLLAALSALDHRTTAVLASHQVDAAFRLLLARLSSLLFMHGSLVPDEFLKALTAAGRNSDAVGVAASFLESGIGSGIRHGDVSELQQEVVHFSRIVDIGSVGLADACANQAARRLRNSGRIPESLKVLSELMIVMRSRLMQRGTVLPTPRLRAHAATSRKLDATTTLWLPDEKDYALVVASPRHRTRKQAAYLFTALLNYLTPVESVIALWAHAVSDRVRAWLDVTLIARDVDMPGVMVSWSHPGGDLTGVDQEPIEWCRTYLPVASAVDAFQASAAMNNSGVVATGRTVHDTVSLSVTCPEEEEFKTVLSATYTGAAVSPEDIMPRARLLIEKYDGPEIASIECGHIHLDRDLDLDQDLGVALGAQALATLAARQSQPPALTPMMDDDHVLVKLCPADYRRFLDERFDQVSMHLVVESSPIIRSVVCALWARLRKLGLAERCRERGQNLFLALENGNFCELFEDVNGENATGCVFFEAALLVYRCAPARFDDYFRERFDVSGVHEYACAILDRAGGHDEKVARLQEFYSRFGDVTDPNRPDSSVVDLVDDVIANAHQGVAHLNVLEDYYEVQQDKVRRLVNMLELPMRLVTMHFNAQTGRVVLDG